jgi:hypothetical protein
MHELVQPSGELCVDRQLFKCPANLAPRPFWKKPKVFVANGWKASQLLAPVLRSHQTWPVTV